MEAVAPVGEDLRPRAAAARAEVAVLVQVLIDDLEPAVRARPGEQGPERHVPAVVRGPEHGTLLAVMEDGLGSGLTGGRVADGSEAAALEIEFVHVLQQ